LGASHPQLFGRGGDRPHGVGAYAVEASETGCVLTVLCQPSYILNVLKHLDVNISKTVRDRGSVPLDNPYICSPGGYIHCLAVENCSVAGTTAS